MFFYLELMGVWSFDSLIDNDRGVCAEASCDGAMPEIRIHLALDAIIFQALV